MFSQLRQCLDAAEAKARDFDELQSSLQIAQQEVQRLEQLVQTQQRQLDSFSAQDQLVSQLTRQVAAQSQALDQLEASARRQEKQIDSAQAQTSAVQQELGQRRKRIQNLEADSALKVQKVEHLEHRLQECRRTCSLVTSHTRRLEEQLHEQEAEQPYGQQNQSLQTTTPPLFGPTNSETKMSAEVPDHDSSLAEGAAGLLAITSTADRSQNIQSKADAQQNVEDQYGCNISPPHADTTGRGMSQEPRAESAPRRQSCIIIGRHPDTPSEVPVVCRQLTGTMLLSDCCQQLRIRYNGSELAPPDFEAAAGCSKGKNWKANIKVQGSNGRNQMLKLWLPGLLQLMGDHSKTTVIKETKINELLDQETGLRILPSEHLA
ncbi:TPA: hypothetical protein ACH3X1_013686 [Trebouxia sp. C0004]